MFLGVDGIIDPEYLLPVILTVGCLLFASFLLKQKKPATDTPWQKVPGARPIVGNSLGDNGIDGLVDKMEEWAKLYAGEQGVFETNIFSRRFLVVCAADSIAKIAKERPYRMLRTSELKATVNSIGGYGLFTAEGHTWKSDRRLVAPALNKKNVRDYLPTIKLVSTRLVEKWRGKAVEEGVVVINSDIFKFAIDNIALIAFGEDFDSVRQDNSSQANDIMTMFKVTYRRIVLPFKLYKIPIIGQYLDGGGWAIRRLTNSLRTLVKEYEENPDIKGPRANTFLAKLVSLSHEENDRMSHERVIGNLLTIFSAGSETTHVTICNSLYEIATDNTGLQDELAAEAQAVDNFDMASMDELLQSLPRFRSLLYEILRMKGPAPMLGVESADEFSFDGVVLPPGTKFMMLLRYASTLDNSGVPLGPNGERPCDFCARRWLVVSDTNTLDSTKTVSVLRPSASMGGSMAYSTGFGTGLRICPGRDLSEIEGLVCLASLLRTFVISLEDGHSPLKLVSRFTYGPDSDIRLVIKPRTSTRRCTTHSE